MKSKLEICVHGTATEYELSGKTNKLTKLLNKLTRKILVSGKYMIFLIREKSILW